MYIIAQISLSNIQQIFKHAENTGEYLRSKFTKENYVFFVGHDWFN